jgi:hypothetical protein
MDPQSRPSQWSVRGQASSSLIQELPSPSRIPENNEFNLALVIASHCDPCTRDKNLSKTEDTDMLGFIYTETC